MKEENFLRRRFSLCPASSTPQKVDPRKLTRNLFFGADNDIYPLSPGKDVEGNSPSALKDETPQTPNSISKAGSSRKISLPLILAVEKPKDQIEYKLCNGSDKECVSPTAKFMKKETLKVQKKNYRQEKKRATKQLFSALKDPSVVITADWLKIRGTLKSWTKLWCVLKPGVLLIYKTPKIGQWVGTILLHSCELIERPSKKDGFCFKLFHPLDQSIWAVKGPKGENVGSITQPLPSSYLIFRAASESDGLIQYPQPAGDGLDEATQERMQHRSEYLNQQMARLIQELEQKSLGHIGVAWGALLVWQFWAVTGILILLLALWFGLHQGRRDPDNSGHKVRSSPNLAEEEEEGHNVVAKKEIESDDANVEENNKDGSKEGSNVDAKAESSAGNEAKEGSDDPKEEVNNDEKGEEVSAAGNEKDKHDVNEEDDGHNVQRNLGSLLEERIQLPVLDLDKGCSIITDLMDKLTHIFGEGMSNSFYPVPQQAIGVGSAFEGWSPHAQDVVYHVLVPLSPPPGHAFHLELDTAGVLQRNCCVRVELLCTCTREQLGEDMLCFLHHSEEELRKQDPSLLHTLCTGTYLDVEKTVHWFHRSVREAWLLLPQWRHWRLMLQPSSRSCKFQLSKEQESFMVEVIFGVRQGDSDIFVGSQPTEAGIPSTTWLETYAVAEAKFFRHISKQAPRDSWHCKCLQLLSRILMGVGFSSYALKTVVMHLLSTVPLTQWCRKDFRRRMMDTLKYLRCSLDTKQLNHFVIGNQRFPTEISLPSDFRVAEAPNLFQHLASNPDAHMKAMQEYVHLLDQLKQMLF